MPMWWCSLAIEIRSLPFRISQRLHFTILWEKIFAPEKLASKLLKQPLKKNFGENPRTSQTDERTKVREKGGKNKIKCRFHRRGKKNMTPKRSRERKKKASWKFTKRYFKDALTLCRGEGFKDLMKMKMEVFICNSKDGREMQEKRGRFDLTPLESQGTDTFIARGWKISKYQWPICVHHNFTPAYFIVKYSALWLPISC